MQMLHGGPKGRTLHLVDLENLLGDERCSGVGRAGLERYLELARWDPGDQTIVAAHPELIRQIGFDAPVPCNLHATRGDDSADRMLLAHAPAELVVARYDRLVLGSGDGIFVRLARTVRAAGVPVLVVARSEGVAARFRRWAFPVVRFTLDVDAALTATVCSSMTTAA